MKKGVGMSWMIAMMITAVIASVMLFKVGRQNRAWMKIAADVQTQFDQRVRVHKEYEFSSARVAFLKNDARLMYWGQNLHLVIHRKSQNRAIPNDHGLADYGDYRNADKDRLIYSMGGTW